MRPQNAQDAHLQKLIRKAGNDSDIYSAISCGDAADIELTKYMHISPIARAETN